MALFFTAYICNLLATPLDDQLSYEWARAPGYWQLPLPRAFERRLSLWHAANLARAAAAGGVWALVCYRGSARVVGAVLEERRARDGAVAAVAERLGGGGAGAAAAAAAVTGYGGDGALPPISAG